MADQCIDTQILSTYFCNYSYVTVSANTLIKVHIFINLIFGSYIVFVTDTYTIRFRFNEYQLH